MEYWYIYDYTRYGEPIWNKAKAYGFRRKNGRDQAFVNTIEGKKWIFVPVVDCDPDKNVRNM